MELAWKALWRRVLNTLFIGGVLFVVTAIAGDGIQWTLLLVSVPLFFRLESRRRRRSPTAPTVVGGLSE
jgi:hypothetical protein